MIYSMTGYGESSQEVNGKTYKIEIRSLNGKSTDIRFKSNINLRNKEIALRKLVLEGGMRGKFDVNLTMSSASGEETQLNLALMTQYYNDLMAFSKDKNIEKGDIIQSIIRLPNVVQVADDDLSDEEWDAIREMTGSALKNINEFRKAEGESLKDDLTKNVNGIMTDLGELDQYIDERIELIKERIKKNLNQHMQDEKIDNNRFEQEILFYLEKLDVNEEKVRLSQHCSYFLKEMNSEHIQKGKKLSFISQEMGREINTLGAKAQHSDIQQCVVRMKDKLEQVKEQVFNIL